MVEHAAEARQRERPGCCLLLKQLSESDRRPAEGGSYAGGAVNGDQQIAEAQKRTSLLPPSEHLEFFFNSVGSKPFSEKHCTIILQIFKKNMCHRCAK